MKTKINLILFLIISFGFAEFLFAQKTESFNVNGLKVILKQNSSVDIIAAQMYFRGGVSVLLPDEAGIEALSLNSAIKASKNYPKDKLNSELERMNTQISTSSGVDFSSIDLLSVKQNFEESWKIFADIIVNPSFTQADFELEKDRQLNIVKQVQDDPDSYLNDLIVDAFFVDHPYRLEVNGTISTLNSFNADQIKKFYQNRLKTSAMLLVVVGNINKAELETKVKEAFGKLETGNYTQTELPIITHPASSLKLVNRSLPTVYIRGAFPAPAFAYKEYYAMSVTASILRDNVWEEVRTKRGLSYAPSAGINANFSNFGSIYVTATNPDSTIQVMINEVGKLKSEQISQKELTNKIMVFITSYYLRNETFQQQASLLARFELSGAGYAETEKYLDYMRNISPADVQSAAQNYMKNLQFVLIGNPSSLKTENFVY
jgi:zinc protease